MANAESLNECIDYYRQIGLVEPPWEELFTGFLTRRDEPLRSQLLNDLYQYFTSTAASIVPELIQRWTTQTNEFASGFAGGRKIVLQNIFFKLYDEVSLYRETAGLSDAEILFETHKGASREVTASNLILSLRQPGIHTPLCCSIQLFGVRVYAAAFVSGLVLRYGRTPDALRFVQDPHAASLLKMLCDKIQLKSHQYVLPSTGQIVSVPGPFDLDAFAVQERTYIIDTARILPGDNPREPFIHVFRPEVLLRPNAIPINPDAWIINTSEEDEGSISAIQWRRCQIDDLVAHLLTTSLNSSNALISALHTRGINLRFLGQIYCQLITLTSGDESFLLSVVSNLEMLLHEMALRTSTLMAFESVVFPALQTRDSRALFTDPLLEIPPLLRDYIYNLSTETLLIRTLERYKVQKSVHDIAQQYLRLDREKLNGEALWRLGLCFLEDDSLSCVPRVHGLRFRSPLSLVEYADLLCRQCDQEHYVLAMYTIVEIMFINPLDIENDPERHKLPWNRLAVALHQIWHAKVDYNDMQTLIIMWIDSAGRPTGDAFAAALFRLVGTSLDQLPLMTKRIAADPAETRSLRDHLWKQSHKAVLGVNRILSSRFPELLEALLNIDPFMFEMN